MKLEAKQRLLAARDQDWFDGLSGKEQGDYLKKNPNSKFTRKLSGPKSIKDLRKKSEKDSGSVMKERTPKKPRPGSLQDMRQRAEQFSR